MDHYIGHNHDRNSCKPDPVFEREYQESPKEKLNTEKLGGVEEPKGEKIFPTPMGHHLRTQEGVCGLESCLSGGGDYDYGATGIEYPIEPELRPQSGYP